MVKKKIKKKLEPAPVICEVKPPQSARSAAALAKHGPADDSRNIGCKRLRKMWKNRRDYSDASVQCGDSAWEVHRAVLSSASPVFDTMFKAKMSESSSHIVQIKECTPDVIEAMLSFIYTGSAPCLATDWLPSVAGGPGHGPRSLSGWIEADSDENEDAESEEEAESAVDEEIEHECDEPQNLAEKREHILSLMEQGAMYQMPDLVRLCGLQLLRTHSVTRLNIVRIMRIVKDFKGQPEFANLVQALAELVQKDSTSELVWALAQHV